MTSFFSSMELQMTTTRVARGFIAAYHYAQTIPPINKVSLLLKQADTTLGVVLLGYGTRPYHTIKRLFPSLGTADYLEINRLWVSDAAPWCTESVFIAKIVNWLKANTPTTKVLFSWADGLRGKPGYIYQASNFLYGGFIESQFYVSTDGEVVHPRLVVTRNGSRRREETNRLGLSKIFGRQFRYIYFLCSHKERKQLLKESPINWTHDYPKDGDCIFWQAGEGSRESHELPMLKGTGRFRHPAPLFDWQEAKDILNGKARPPDGGT